jgi:hypothetical protein
MQTNSPSLMKLNPIDGIISKKSIIKSNYGQIDLEEYEDDEMRKLYKFNLKLKDLQPEIAQEIIRVMTPFFEDPINPQLELFVEEK